MKNLILFFCKKMKILTFEEDYKNSGFSIFRRFKIDVVLTEENKQKIVSYIDQMLKDHYSHNDGGLTYQDDNDDIIVYKFTIHEFNRILDNTQYYLGTEDEYDGYLYPYIVKACVYEEYDIDYISIFIN